MNIDPVELLRAQGDLLAHNKKERAERAQAEKIAKECTFVPDTKKPKYKPFKKIEESERTSIGSINLNGIAKKKDEDPFQQPDQGTAKFNQLYSMRKR